MSKRFLRVAISSVFFLLLTTSIAPLCGDVFAQTLPAYPQPSGYVPADQNYDDFIRNVNQANQTGVQNVDSYYGETIINRVMLGLTNMLGGDMLSSNPSGQPQNEGLIGFATGTMGQLYANPPASGIEYVASMAQQAHLVPQAYAQTAQQQQGFQAIAPLQAMWAAMRDVAYILYIPIFIFIGISIMFRTKIDAHSYASVQAAIPKIILSLILVTFSFAIVGFLIDIMNIAMGLVANFFIGQGFIKNSILTDPNNGIYNTNLFKFVNSNFSIVNLSSAPGAVIGDIVSKATSGTTPIPFLNNVLGGAANLTVHFVLIIALVIVLVRTLFTLIMAYISIVAFTILGPILIVFDAIPGRGGFSFWIKYLLSNLAVFPCVLALLLFAAALGGGNDATTCTGSTVCYSSNPQPAWVPPFIGGFAGSGAQGFQAFVAFGAILMLPGMLAQVQKFFKTQVDLGPILAPVGHAMGTAGTYASAAYGESFIGRGQRRREIQQHAADAEAGKEFYHKQREAADRSGGGGHG